jgi:hypothetical protein
MNSKQARSLASFLAIFSVLFCCFNNCGQRKQMSFKSMDSLAAMHGGTSGGNPTLTAMTFSPYGTGAGDQQAGAATDDVLLSFTLCLDSVHFTSVDGSEFTHMIRKELQLKPDGTVIGSVPLPAGNYTTVVFDIADACGTGRSLSIENKAGTIETAVPMQMTFQGEIGPSAIGKTLEFEINAIASGLAAAVSSEEAKTAVTDRLINPIAILTD